MKLTWILQGCHYDNDPEVIEVGSLLGGAICYRRSAVEEAGGWAVEGLLRPCASGRERPMREAR